MLSLVVSFTLRGCGSQLLIRYSFCHIVPACLQQVLHTGSPLTDVYKSVEHELKAVTVQLKLAWLLEACVAAVQEPKVVGKRLWVKLALLADVNVLLCALPEANICVLVNLQPGRCL